MGFTGGVNLADEYINQKERFGHWKDTAVMLKGEAVWNMTAMFLHMWNVITNNREDHSLEEYLPHVWPVSYTHLSFYRKQNQDPSAGCCQCASTASRVHDGRS